MADWKKYYEEHLVTMAEAAGKIKSGDTIWMGSSLCIPYDFMELLADRYEELSNVTLLGNMYLSPVKVLFDPTYKKAFHTISFFPNVFERMSADMGIVDLHSAPYGSLFETVTRVYKANVVAVEVCPSDEEGYFNVGLLGTNFTPNIMHNGGLSTKIAVYLGACGYQKRSLHHKRVRLYCSGLQHFRKILIFRSFIFFKQQNRRRFHRFKCLSLKRCRDSAGRFNKHLYPD